MKSTQTLLMLFTITACLISQALAADNQLTKQEKKDGWQLLFNGEDLTGWKCNNGNKIATKIEDGSLVPYKSGGYIVVHEKEYGDFILKCDVKMGDPCNSGIFLRIGDLLNPVHTGFEIQVMNGDGTGKHDFGAIYDLAGTTKNAAKGPGNWESIEIKCQGPIISVTVNGTKVSEINCDDFDKPGFSPDGKKHKYKLNKKPIAVKDFARKGYLGFQDHGHKVWYKNVKLKQL
ncbi:MAG: hypothetical protein COA78_26735 [Blastopirellula sp.]|nr:MAG: hypothetical protein COA78_26735 [Blastopirellula sp.]